MYDEYLDNFMPSKDMREYLKNENLNVYDIAQIIYGSPRPVDEKLNALKECCELYTDGSDEYTVNCIEGMISCIERALNIIEKDGIYSLEMCIYDQFRYHTDRSLESLYCRFDEAVAFVNDICGDIASDYLIWFEIIKWAKNNNDKLYEECTYYYVKKELRYINASFSINGFAKKMIGGGDLNLPVPFKPGDIVCIDGCNITPRFYALILEIGDNSDCCSLQGLARDDSFRWRSGAIKHGMIGAYYDEHPSMLYTIERYDGFLKIEDEILIDISNYLKQDSENAREFVDKIKCGRSFSDSELNALMCTDNKSKNNSTLS